jgi:hypothetical protein
MTLLWLSVIGNFAGSLWAWHQGNRFARAQRALREICFMAWPFRRDPRLARLYLSTIGRAHANPPDTE